MSGPSLQELFFFLFYRHFNVSSTMAALDMIVHCPSVIGFRDVSHIVYHWLFAKRTSYFHIVSPLPLLYVFIYDENERDA